MMPFEPVRTLTSRTVALAQENIDTDQIIPARFLTTTERAGLGAAAFYDWRFDLDGAPRADSIFEVIEPAEYRILVAGANFGCGSSREHAVWALLDFGFRAVVSAEIADIFKSNALKNGLIPIEVDAEYHEYLLAHPGAMVSIDLEREIIGALGGGNSSCFALDPFARRCLMQGVDPLGFLLNQSAAIDRFETRRS